MTKETLTGALIGHEAFMRGVAPIYKALTSTSTAQGVVDMLKGKASKNLSYNKTKNYARAAGAMHNTANATKNLGSSTASRYVTPYKLTDSQRAGQSIRQATDAILNDTPSFATDLNRAKTRMVNDLTNQFGYGLVGNRAANSLGAKMFQNAELNELKRAGTYVAGSTGAGLAGAAAVDGLTKKGSFQFAMNKAQAIAAGGAVGALLVNKANRVRGAHNFLKNTTNKPLDILLNRNAIGANMHRGKRPGFGYNKKLDEYAKKENLKSTIARLGLGTTVGAGTYAGVTS